MSYCKLPLVNCYIALDQPATVSFCYRVPQSSTELSISCLECASFMTKAFTDRPYYLTLNIIN